MTAEFLKNWETQLKKGLLPLYIIKALSGKERYGYELIEQLKIQGIVVTEGTIYPLLIRLMKDGILESKWVEQPSGIPRKYYKITDEGRRALKGMNTIIDKTVLKLRAK